MTLNAVQASWSFFIYLLGDEVSISIDDFSKPRFLYELRRSYGWILFAFFGVLKNFPPITQELELGWEDGDNSFVKEVPSGSKNLDI
ncbi:hypothetical protein Tco_0639913 [Tanacetum coccineum]|uniref:Uncharacterized protein n=1 Tax=Tanacetum coccineum TaxID=301880 RepID=A0ABQ5BU29_9ASTR